MKLHFYKYQGTGNDFIIIDERKQAFQPDEKLVHTLCDRRFGIGADGLMLLNNHDRYDFSMRYFNSDGHESTMCGNGGRCIASLAQRLKMTGDHTLFQAIDGTHEAYLDNPGGVRLKMKDVSGIKKIKKAYFLDTGSPHYVTYVHDVHKTDIVKEGQKIRYNRLFAPGGTNVNFVQRMDENTLFVRTYERGVENETFSCGTGVTASAIASVLHWQASDKTTYTIETLGGKLTVYFKQAGSDHFDNIWLEGPATFVFEGDIAL